MTLGPVDFIALEFPGNNFKGDILPDIFELVDQGAIRVFDLVEEALADIAALAAA
jgi:hypothetical protein